MTTTTRTTRLREWRVHQGLTLDEVADVTGMSKSMLSRAERGERHLAPLTRIQMARRLHVPVRDLFEVEELPA